MINCKRRYCIGESTKQKLNYSAFNKILNTNQAETENHTGFLHKHENIHQILITNKPIQPTLEMHEKKI